MGAGPGGAAAARRVELRVLGPLEVVEHGTPVAIGGPKERTVLAVLLARANGVVSVDTLVDAVWSGRPPRTAERTIAAYIARLRAVVEPRREKGGSPSVLVSVGGGYRLEVDADAVDALRFERLARAGVEQLRHGEATAASTLRIALGLWRGPAYPEFGDVEACAAEARRLEELRLSAQEDRFDADLAAGEARDLVNEIEAALAEQPFRERLWGQLMLALYRDGRQRQALDAYQRARRLLVDELGIEPGPALQRLDMAVLAQDPELDLPRRSDAMFPGPLPLPLEAVGSAFVGRQAERRVSVLRAFGLLRALDLV